MTTGEFAIKHWEDRYQAGILSGWDERHPTMKWVLDVIDMLRGYEARTQEKG